MNRQVFTKEDVIRYYNATEDHYRYFWDLKTSLALHYGFWFPGTNNLREALKNTNKTLAEMTAVTAGDHVLDAGCGVGGAVDFLCNTYGCKATGISLSNKQIQLAKERIEKERWAPLADFVEDDFTDSQLSSEQFTVVWAIESIGHAGKAHSFLKEAWRLLKPDGKIAIADFFKEENLSVSQSDYVQKLANGWAINDYETLSSVIAQLSQAGFTDIKQQTMTSFIMPSARRLYYGFPLGWLAVVVHDFLFPKKSKTGYNNIMTAYWQYKALKNSWVNYYIVTATKPMK